MNSFLQSAVSLYEQGIEACHLSATNRHHDFIVPGYTHHLTANQQEPLPENYDHCQAGIFYADIADCSHLTEQDEEGTHHRLVESMKIMQAHIAANNGKVAHFADDAILAEFKDPDSALHCAINVQLSARQWNADLHANQQVLFRIGVNFGDVIADHDDISGNAVNLAARLEKLAHTGGICVSESIRHELKNHSSFKFVAMGKQYVKNISGPVQAFWIEFDAEQVEKIDQTNFVRISAVAL
jgi:class 3 adenylate cyclase